MKYFKGDIVLIPYPFSDLSTIKVRPALVVSYDEFNEKSKDLICVPLTSVLKNEKYSVFISQESLVKGDLIKDSRIKCEKLFCVDKKVVKMKIGCIKNSVFLKVKSEMRKVL